MMVVLLNYPGLEQNFLYVPMDVSSMVCQQTSSLLE